MLLGLPTNGLHSAAKDSGQHDRLLYSSVSAAELNPGFD